MTKKIYSTTVLNRGGREGSATLPDGTHLYDIALPGTKLENGLTDPERLFAAAYSACFNQALTVAKEKMGIETTTIVETTVDLYELNDNTFMLGVKLTVTVPNVSKANAEHMVNYADRICPYSRALRNNIKVEISVES
ncbi:Ohr family peroxiredoxin [Enterococcus hulanensis]|uniref:Ohr family peroxiredoxin n=1 Tax=Enterococcus hulanensis TaxID=2559929 RepID=A0ABU3F1H1_9ENTE|nr:Ohr family peroxiredoxin [Enterococcus hulanensis]MDT2600971.1 Ohr family peroxiredoxin [Enterococcus hulanensis]MDT2611560.1 Ohr family peroxiredoxin [Enterococcus hulanensis]MDT2617956.1 Ohr family peroxiredoxin [Enterococcus hulanensis]MDT2628959.1 Ohr family peroxiredoxin [Enterococcus hulanensis]MDT2656521.1 Ohr family peroxiredoxin [Enterococcus hulanensis]